MSNFLSNFLVVTFLSRDHNQWLRPTEWNHLRTSRNVSDINKRERAHILRPWPRVSGSDNRRLNAVEMPEPEPGLRNVSEQQWIGQNHNLEVSKFLLFQWKWKYDWVKSRIYSFIPFIPRVLIIRSRFCHQFNYFQFIYLYSLLPISVPPTMGIPKFKAKKGLCNAAPI